MSLFLPMMPTSQDVYLLIHSCVPQSLADKVHYYTCNFKSTCRIMLSFMDSFFHLVYYDIWLPYLDQQKAWEHPQGITRKKKINYRRNQVLRRRCPHDSSPANVAALDTLHLSHPA